MKLDQLLKQYERKQELRDKYLSMVYEDKESILDQSKRTGRTVTQIQHTQSSFMRKAMDRQKDMDKLAKQIEEASK